MQLLPLLLSHNPADTCFGFKLQFSFVFQIWPTWGLWSSDSLSLFAVGVAGGFPSVSARLIQHKKVSATPGTVFEGPAASMSTQHRGGARSQLHHGVPPANVAQQHFLNRGDHATTARKPSQAVRVVTQNGPENSMSDHPDIAPSNAEAEPDASLLEARVSLVTVIADLFRDDKDEAVTLRELLRTGELEGQPVKMLDGSYLPIKGTKFDG